MSEIKVDTYELRRDYPFLDKIWNLYEEFNETVDNSDEYKFYYGKACEGIKNLVENDKKWYNDICIKLLRLLGIFSSVKNTDKYNSERCKSINSWLYYIIKDYDVHQDAFTNICDVSKGILNERVKNPYCSYYLYKDKYNDPDKIIKLINLQDYMNDALSMLKKGDDKNHCLFRKFIYECANIYKEVNKKYCGSGTFNSSKKPNTCAKLKEFSTFFKLYISTKENLIGKLPSLYNEETEKIPICPTDTGVQELKLEQKQELYFSG
ncbi:hypothetical protein PCYB_007430, partial [Plasmodium cynomolgi strain B]